MFTFSFSEIKVQLGQSPETAQTLKHLNELTKKILVEQEETQQHIKNVMVILF